jgi:hypothetical protein
VRTEALVVHAFDFIVGTLEAPPRLVERARMLASQALVVDGVEFAARQPSEDALERRQLAAREDVTRG